MTALAVALLVVALLLLLAEAHLSTGGLIGLLAAVAAVCGILLLLLAASASLAVVLAVPLGVAAALGSLLVLARRRILGPAHGRPRTGREALLGCVGTVRSTDGEHAEVFVSGSLWRAERRPYEGDGELHEGDRVIVESVDGLTLAVRKAEEWEMSR